MILFPVNIAPNISREILLDANDHSMIDVYYIRQL
jgi:hypothetical protein